MIKLPVVKILRNIFFALAAIGLHIWSAAVVYYCAFPYLNRNIRLTAAIAYLVSVLAFVFFSRNKMRRLILSLAGFLAMALFYLSIRPDPCAVYPAYLKPAYVELDGSKVIIHDVRNNDYHTKDDFTVRYEPRTYDIREIRSLDLFVNFWGPKSVSHTFLSFGFADGSFVAVSVEFRPEVGEVYDLWAGIFKRYELIYIWGDERDLVRLRTNYRKEDVYLYRVKLQEEEIRRLFVRMLERTNQIYAHPEFYNTLFHSCTNTIANDAVREGIAKVPFWKRRIFTGDIDRREYNQGRFFTGGLDFEQLREASDIGSRAAAADKDADFSRKIRTHLRQF